MKWKIGESNPCPKCYLQELHPVYRHLVGLSSDCSEPLSRVKFYLISLSKFPTFSGYIGQVNVTPIREVFDPLVNIGDETEIPNSSKEVENIVPD